ncbi:hypothetical protein CH304_00405 [Rhodococcus sp. 15-649-1-2]|nr:hypothetical protein [Rhodococcus sp. 15-649-1-2]OZE88066.1 hypothetical protein CH304_00405 [Rhodococcus sp. 15-649-1-2]
MATNPAIPTQWIDVFDGRSLRTIAAAADISVDRVSRFIRGGKVADGTADLVADALGISTRRALELRGEPVREPFRLPDKAHYLSRRQRDAVLSVIDAMLDPSIEASGEGTATVTPIGAPKPSDVETKAALKGETDELRRRRLTKAPEDVSQDPDDDDR